MHEPLYRDALKHGWRLTWQHKILWVYGLFAALLGQMGIFEFFRRTHVFGKDPFLVPLSWSWGTTLDTAVRQLGESIATVDKWVWAVWLLLISVGLLAALLFVAVVSQGALIQSAAQSIIRKKLPDEGEAWHRGVTHFWPLLVVNALRSLSFLLLGLAVGWATVNAVFTPGFFDNLLFLIIFVLSLGVGMIMSFITVYAAGYIMVEDYSFGRALHDAWRLFLEHWLVSCEVGVILLVCNIAVVLLTFFGLLVFFFPAILIWLVALMTVNYSLFISGFVVGVVLFVLFIMWLASLFTVFSTTTWTYLFMKMHRHGISSRILRVLRRT